MTRIVKLDPAQRGLVDAMAKNEAAIRQSMDSVEAALTARDFTKVHQLLARAAQLAGRLEDQHVELKARADR